MADLKISQLTGASTPLAGTEVLPIVQSGSTKKVSVADLTAGRPVAMAGGSFTDNITQSTAGKGIDFSANTPSAGMTSELLNWYEEGTFTPTLTTDGTNFTSVAYVTQLGNYTRVGREVSFSLNIYTSAVVIGLASGNVQIAGLPFVQNGSGIRSSPTVGVVLLWAVDAPSGGEMQDSSARINLLKRALITGSTSNLAVTDVATAAGNFIRMSGTYFV
jgi:hypothetical protein